jgi:hypothetical protein
MSHPHPNKRHVVKAMRRYLLGVKRTNGTARNLGHYQALIQTYLTAKRAVCA